MWFGISRKSGEFVIVILSAEPGMGKTYQAAGWEEPILYLDMENRADRTIKKYYSSRMIELRSCMQYTKDYKEDQVSTLIVFEKALRLADCSTVVIDGISDIRDYCYTLWLKETKRKQAMNPGDWEQINDKVRNLLFPLINECKAKNIHLVMTAQFKDEYGMDSEGKSVKIGRIPALKEWQQYNVDTLITLQYKKPNYIAVCSKSIAGCWEENITNKNLYEVLLEKGV